LGPTFNNRGIRNPNFSEIASNVLKKNLAKPARSLGALSGERFEEVVSIACDAATGRAAEREEF
jgi:hypothetical protein